MRISLAFLLFTTTALAQTSACPAIYRPMPPAPKSPVLPFATRGKPQIDQVRAGKPIATYTTFADGPNCSIPGDGTAWQNPGIYAAQGCGPFTREHHFRLWAPGDVFNVHAAVYSGQLNQPYIGPDFTSGTDYPANPSIPTSITIHGLVEGDAQPVILQDGAVSNNTLGQAPVYIDTSSGVVWDHISVACAQAPCPAGRAGIYDAGGSNLTISDTRVTGFSPGNGIFGAGQYEGDLRLIRVELDHNGGTDSSYDHNAYIAGSALDPNFRVVLRGSYLHDAWEGHLFKTRAQVGEIDHDYFQGGLPQPGKTQAETYDLDIPNGGRYRVVDDTFVKGASGVGSNGISLAWYMEGQNATPGTAGYPKVRPQHLTATGNTFAAYAATYDGVGGHPLIPIELGYPAAVPPIAGEVVDVSGNVFSGYCVTGVAADDWRGSP